jgi:hypothetical protein
MIPTKTFFKKLGIIIFAVAPLIAWAQQRDLKLLMELVVNILATIVPIVFGIALAVFFFGIAQFILSVSDSQKKTEGRQIIVWGIIALFVMVSLWGIVKTLKATFFG